MIFPVPALLTLKLSLGPRARANTWHRVLLPRSFFWGVDTRNYFFLMLEWWKAFISLSALKCLPLQDLFATASPLQRNIDVQKCIPRCVITHLVTWQHHRAEARSTMDTSLTHWLIRVLVILKLESLFLLLMSLRVTCLDLILDFFFFFTHTKPADGCTQDNLNFWGIG